MAVRYKEFPIYSTWSSFFNSASLQLPPILFASLFNPAIAGLYSLAHRALAMPLSLVGRAIADVFFSNAAVAHRKNELSGLISDIHDKLAHIAMAPTLILILIAPELFEFVFGSEWKEAGIYAQWLAPWLYLVFITSPLSTTFSIMEKQAKDAIFQSILLLGRVGAILFGAKTGDVMTTIKLFAVVSAVCWFGLLIWIMMITKNSILKMIKPTVYSFLIAIVLVSPIIIFMVLFPEDRVILLGGLLLSVIFISARYFYLLKEAY